MKTFFTIIWKLIITFLFLLITLIWVSVAICWWWLLFPIDSIIFNAILLLLVLFLGWWFFGYNLIKTWSSETKKTINNKKDLDI